jgi:hypothetical protein
MRKTSVRAHVIWLAVILGAGLLGAGVASAASSPPINVQIQQLKDQVLGTTLPDDPDVLRARNAEYEQRFAQIGSPAPPHDVVLSFEDYDRYVDTGIHSPVDYVPDFDFTNFWSGVVNGKIVSVFAGARTDQPTVGGVVVQSDGAGMGDFIVAPGPTGPLTIVSAAELALTLTDAHGKTVIFDLSTHAFRQSSYLRPLRGSGVLVVASSPSCYRR